MPSCVWELEHNISRSFISSVPTCLNYLHNFRMLRHIFYGQKPLSLVLPNLDCPFFAVECRVSNISLHSWIARVGQDGPRQIGIETSCSSCEKRRPSCRTSSWSANSSTARRRCCSWRRSAPGWRRRSRGPTAPRARGPIRGEDD